MMQAEKPLLYPVTNNQPTQRIYGGFYLKARCIQNSIISIAPPHVREIWDWILKEANHKDMNTHGKTIHRGQLLTTYKEIQEGLHWNEGYIKKTYKKHHVDYAMRRLTQEQMITTQKTTRGLIITVCKYERYQNPANYEAANDYDNQKTIKRQSTDTINKNDKNDKNEKKKYIAPTLDEVKEYFVSNGYSQDVAERAYKGYAAADWHDTKGSKVKNWKQKMINVWFRDENKIPNNIKPMVD